MPAHPQGRLAGIVMMALSVLMFAGSNVAAKWVVSSAPVGETLFIRSLVALLFLAPLLRPRDLARLRGVGHPWLHLLRLAGQAGDSFCYYWAVSVLPLADASAIYLASPICVTALSAAFLGEQVDWRRWLAVLVGFIGVLIALRPGPTTLSSYALVALVGMVSYSVSAVAIRRLRRVPNRVLVASQAASLALFMVVTAGGWVWPTPAQLGLIVLIGLFSLGGFVLMTRGLQLAPASVVVPFQYTGIVWACVFGWLVFGDVPGPATLLGAAVIIAAGSFIVLRERR